MKIKTRQSASRIVVNGEMSLRKLKLSTYEVVKSGGGGGGEGVIGYNRFGG